MSEQYTIRRKFFKLFGSSFHIHDAQGTVVGFCKQKSFRLREDIRIYTSEAKDTELLRIGTRSIMDISGTYVFMAPPKPGTAGEGEVIGMMRRKGLTSTFLRDEWLILSPQGQQVATLREQGSFLSFARRYIDFVSLISPQKFDIFRQDGSVAATLRQHFNPFLYRMGVSITQDDKTATDGIDDLVILAAACLVSIIEGRQQ
jgi:uncharacterized protein YxjI